MGKIYMKWYLRNVSKANWKNGACCIICLHHLALIFNVHSSQIDEIHLLTISHITDTSLDTVVLVSSTKMFNKQSTCRCKDALPLIWRYRNGIAFTSEFLDYKNFLVGHWGRFSIICSGIVLLAFRYIISGTLLITWFNFNPSKDK